VCAHEKSEGKTSKCSERNFYFSLRSSLTFRFCFSPQFRIQNFMASFIDYLATHIDDAFIDSIIKLTQQAQRHISNIFPSLRAFVDAKSSAPSSPSCLSVLSRKTVGLAFCTNAIRFQGRTLPFIRSRLCFFSPLFLSALFLLFTKSPLALDSDKRV
jgi:hypothetical protein